MTREVEMLKFKKERSMAKSLIVWAQSSSLGGINERVVFRAWAQMTDTGRQVKRQTMKTTRSRTMSLENKLGSALTQARRTLDEKKEAQYEIEDDVAREQARECAHPGQADTRREEGGPVRDRGRCRSRTSSGVRSPRPGGH